MAIDRTTTLTSGNDTWDALAHPPTDANDTVHAGKGNDTVWGYDGNDKLFGEKGNDTLRGESGTDELHGGQGIDKLYGGKDADQLYGGKGADKFYFEYDDSGLISSNSDTIHDFGKGDKIYLDGNYSYAGNTAGPNDGEYGTWKYGSDYVVTWNSPNDNDYHDVVVKGSDPAGDILFA